jgi:hypothetical protein
MVYSATVALPDNPKFAATRTFFLQRGTWPSGIGMVCALVPCCRCRWPSGKSTRR